MKTLFRENELLTLECEQCGKDLLNPPNGHLLLKDEYKTDRRIISDIRWLCRSCDNDRIYGSWGWKDLPDLFLSKYLIQWILGIMVDFHMGRVKFSDEAMEKTMQLLLIIFPRIFKEITSEQKEELELLYELPRFLGGLG